MRRMELDLILASGSPRRHEILNQAGLFHRVLTAPADESAVPFPAGDPAAYVMALAELKNGAVRDAYPAEVKDAVILSADTVVWSPELGMPLGKPHGRDDAVRMLRALSGKSHEVITGVMLRDMRGGGESLFAEVTEVFFREPALRDGEFRGGAVRIIDVEQDPRLIEFGDLDRGIGDVNEI